MKKKDSDIRKKRLTGRVVSDKMDRTVVVRIEKLKMHPTYKKRYYLDKNILADNPNDKFKEGDRVVIEESRPISKKKRFTAIKKLKDKNS